MENRALLIINPVSGDGIAKRWVYEITKELSKKYKLLTLYYTKGNGDVQELVKKTCSEYDAVICAGGDGTLAETVKGVILNGTKTPIGYIPAGTMNDFASSRKLPNTISDALYNIVNGSPKEYDCFSVCGVICTYVASFGSFMDMSYNTSRRMKETFGAIAYVTETLKRIPNLKGYKMWFEDKGKIVSGEYIVGFVSNSPTAAGFRMFDEKEQERLDDGEVEITLVKYPYNIADFNLAFNSLVTGSNSEYIYRTKIKETVFHFDIDNPIWTVEGEKGPSMKDMEIKVIPKGLSFITRTEDDI